MSWLQKYIIFIITFKLLANARALGIIQITPERQLIVRQLTEMTPRADAEVIISGNQKQGKINNNMEKIMNKYTSLFQGLGSAKANQYTMKLTEH